MIDNPSESDPDDVLSDVWGRSEDPKADTDCSPTKVCRNAREFTFDGIADDGSDLSTAWRKLLENEGKRSSGGPPSVRDLVLGTPGE